MEVIIKLKKKSIFEQQQYLRCYLEHSHWLHSQTETVEHLRGHRLPPVEVECSVPESKILVEFINIEDNYAIH